MNTNRIIGLSFLVWIIGTVFGILTCGWLFNWVYQIPPNIWKAPEQIMSAGNFIGSAIAGLLISFIFVIVYAYLHKKLPYKGAKNGLFYGFIIWLVSAFSGIISMPFYMTISVVVVVYWIISALILNLINGAIIGALYKEK